jgi:RsiW-degrading membrane proteinase PrsW (M82 family)
LGIVCGGQRNAGPEYQKGRMREFALTAAALVFPCLLILGGVIVALRRQVPPVPFRTVGRFLGLGVAAIILHGVSFLLAEAKLLGRVDTSFYYAFVTAALPEEGFRYLMIRWGLARRPRAGLVTAMLLGSLVGLTFGALEHVSYALDKGWETWLARSFTSVPYHTLSGAVLGYCAAVAIRTRRPWGLAGLAFLVLVHGLADWPLFDPNSDEPVTFLTSGWAGNIASLVVVAVLAVVFARIARKADAAPAEPSAAADPRRL